MSAGEEVTLSGLLARQARERPHAIAFVEHGREISNAAFAADVARAAAWLARHGVGPGDRVAVWLVNRIEWLALYFALAQRGAALVAINTRYRAGEVEHILGLSRAKMLVTQTEFRSIDFPGVLAGVGGAKLISLEKVALVDADADAPAILLGKPVVVFDAFEPSTPALAALASPLPLAGEGQGGGNSQTRRLPPPSPGSLRSSPSTASGRAAERSVGPSEMHFPRDLSDPDAPSTMFATSGTTKGPKLVVHPQRTVAVHAQRCAARFGFAAPDAKLIAAMPFCGTFGLIALLAAFAGGAPALIVDAFDAPSAARLMRDQTVTHAFGSDEMFRRLADEVPGDDPYPAARYFGYAAFAPGAADLARALWRRRMPLYGLYGSSEVGALFAMQPEDLPVEQRIEAGGRTASADAAVRIRDIESGALLPVGESGEIELKAATNFTAYFDNAAATADAITEDGFFRTGDVGRLRADGTFVYESRRDDSIRLAGFLVNPAEIEDEIKALPGVADVQVVAVKVGERMRSIAFVVAVPGAALDADALAQAAAVRLAGFKAPARIFLVDDFPKTEGPNGTKVQRGKLREMAMVRIAGET